MNTKTDYTKAIFDKEIEEYLMNLMTGKDVRTYIVSLNIS